jgi:2-dehydropantoate 2-reductase
MEKNMRLIIYGAGAIGCVVGGHLARTGHNVLLIGRPGHINAINEYGLKLITPTDTYTLQLPAVTSPGQVEFDPNDVVCFCMKGQNTEEALHGLSAIIRDIPILCFQNGIRNEEIVSQYFPKAYGVMVRVGAVYLTDGEVIARSDPPGWLVMGCYPNGIDELAEAVATKLRTAGFFVKTTPEVMSYKWGKLIDNLGDSIGAITNVRGHDIEKITRAARQEFRNILTQAGFRWVSKEQVAQEWPEITAPLRGRLDTEAQSSTWQSLARNQGTVETEFLNGEVVRLASELGQKAPINEKLSHISLEMAANNEPPGKYTPAQLSALLGLA